MYIYNMSTEQILDLIINYAYSRKEEIQKHRVLLRHEQNTPTRQVDDAKSWKLIIG
jgi:hypothetical protein